LKSTFPNDSLTFSYNLVYWSQGFLPWKDGKLKEQPEIVHRLKEIFMSDVKEVLKLIYGKDVPKYLGEFMDYVGHLEFDEGKREPRLIERPSNLPAFQSLTTNS
jgi:hypothetical protein